MTPARLERATFGLGTPGTGSQAFPVFPCSLESGEIRLNPPGCFSLSFPVFPHRHPKYIQSQGGFGKAESMTPARLAVERSETLSDQARAGATVEEGATTPTVAFRLIFAR